MRRFLHDLLAVLVRTAVLAALAIITITVLLPAMVDLAAMPMRVPVPGGG